MSAQTVVITAIAAAVFLAIAWAMLAGGTGIAASEWQLAATVTEADCWLTPADLDLPGKHRATDDGEPLPYRPPADQVDDWTADLPTLVIGCMPVFDLADLYDSTALPTEQLTDADLADVYDDAVLAAARFVAETEAPRHTSPSAVSADAWPPIFAQLAAELGYDAEFGFDTGLVVA